MSKAEREQAKLYAKAREMTLAEFVDYCVWFYMNTTPLDPDALITPEDER